MLDQRVPRFDGFVGKLKGNFLLQVIKRKQRQDEKEDTMQKEMFRRRMEEVVKIEEITMEMKRKGFEFTRDHIPTKVSVKLPKLKMKKFEGNSLRLVSVLESV